MKGCAIVKVWVRGNYIGGREGTVPALQQRLLTPIPVSKAKARGKQPNDMICIPSAAPREGGVRNLATPTPLLPASLDARLRTG